MKEKKGKEGRREGGIERKEKPRRRGGGGEWKENKIKCREMEVKEDGTGGEKGA